MVRSMSSQSMSWSQEQSCSRISPNYENSRQTFSEGTSRLKIKHKCPLIRIFYSQLSSVASSKCLNASMSCGQSMNRNTCASSWLLKTMLDVSSLSRSQLRTNCSFMNSKVRRWRNRMNKEAQFWQIYAKSMQLQTLRAKVEMILI